MKTTYIPSNIDARVQESYTRMGQWSLMQQAGNNFYLYLYGRTDGARQYKFRMNLIQGVCIANAAIQTGDEPRAKLMPRESGEKAICWINTNSAFPMDAPILGMLRPETWSKEAPGFPEPLNEQEKDIVEQAVAMGKQARLQAQATGMPPPPGLLPDDFYIEVNDSEVASAMQTLLDVKFEEADFTSKLIENGLYNNIFGMQFMLTEFDREEKRLIFSNPYYSTVHIDPYKTDIKDAQYVIFDEFIDADEAKGLWPELTLAINDKATIGPPQLPGNIPYSTPLPWMQALMGRKVVIIRTAWIRNQPFPMDVELAVKRGKIRHEIVPDDAAAIGAPTLGTGDSSIADAGAVGGMPDGQSTEGLPTELGDESSQASQPKDGSSGVDAVSPIGSDDGTENNEGGGFDGIQGRGGDGSVESQAPQGRSGVGGFDPSKYLNPDAIPAPPVPMRDAFYLMSTGEEIKQDDPRWPLKRGIREIRIIASEVVYDRECEAIDIPLGLNVNIPVPYTPYGQGEPDRLEPLQRAYNATLSDIVEHGDAVTFAPKLAARSLMNDNPEIARIGFNDPKKVYPVDDRIMQQGIDKVIGSVVPPELPADTWKREQTLKERFDQESDQNAVSRGELPTDSPMSGNAIGQLQSAAKTSIDFKALRMKTMVRHIVKVAIGYFRKYISPKEAAEIVRKYPEQVWTSIYERGKNVEYDISIQLGDAGDGEAQTIVNAANTPVGQKAISPQSFLEALKLDPETQVSNWIEWSRKQAMMPQPVDPNQAAPVGPSSNARTPP